MSAAAAGMPPATAAELLARDHAAREAAQTCFDRPLVLEAGAGTGKTTTLVARLLAWCLGDGWERAAAAGAAGGETAPRVLRRVVAVTFTEAAAAEMAVRTGAELERLAAGGAVPDWLAAARLPGMPERSRRAAALLGAFDLLAVETLHAFCLRLLTAHPLAAGVHPRLVVDADGRLLEQIVEETVEAALRPGYGAPGDPDLLALAAEGHGPREVAEALKTLAGAGLPAAALRQDPFAGGGWPRLRQRLGDACATLHGLVAPPLQGAAKLRNAQQIVQALAELSGLREAATADATGRPMVVPEATEVSGRVEIPGGRGVSKGAGAGMAAPRDPAEAAAALAGRVAELLPANLRSHLAKWRRARHGGTEESLLAPLGAALPAAVAALERLLKHLEALAPALLHHARLALAPLLEQVERELRQRGIATFDSLLAGARRLLAERPEVRARVRRGIDQLLVDELQDTDATQCEVLRWIALDGPPAERPGLFLVGDPKQSIYGWRSADLRAYQDLVRRVEEAGGEVLPLVESFRSVPAILEEVERVMRQVMHARPGVQPAFAELVPCPGRAAERGFTTGGRAPVEHWVSWMPQAQGRETGGMRPPPDCTPRTAAAAELEADAVAADLAELHDRHGVPWREAAILLRGMGDAEVYLDALRRRGIPFAVARDRQYFRRREVIEAAALVRAVVDPGDHLALVTVLRSPLAGVPDAALMPLWRHRLPRLLTDLHAPDAAALAAVRQAVEAALAEVPPDIPGLDRVAGWELALLALVEGLAVLRQSFREEPADLFLERLRRLPLLDATAAAHHQGVYRLANLDRFFRQLLQEIERGGDAAAVLRTLRENVAAGRDAEEGRPPETTEDAVQVLTIHGAKGLDFPHVYLPQLHKQPGGDRSPATAVGRPGGAEPFEYRLLGAATPGFDLVEQHREQVEAAERVRTLYVAMTRAKDRLVLAGIWPAPEAAPMAPDRARTHMHLLARRPGCPDLERLWNGDPAAGDGDNGGDAVLWRFPALALEPAPVPYPLLQLGGAGGEGKDAGRRRSGVSPQPPPAEVAAQAAHLAAATAAAADRMARPFGAPASAEAHAQLREERAAGRPEGEAREAVPAAAFPPSGEAAQEVAMAAGAALHRALELWDLAAEPRQEAARQRGRLRAYLAAVAAGGTLEQALPRSAALLDSFLATGLAGRLHGLAGHVLARELPVLLEPAASAPSNPSAGAHPAGPVAFIAGAVDLLYRDPSSGELVIADYKTDTVAGADLARRAASYSSQGAVYVRAVQQALDLAAPPRFELWFVRTGEIVAPAFGSPSL